MLEHPAIIIMRDTLRALGLRHLLASLFNMSTTIAADASILVTNDNKVEQYDLIIIDEFNCLSHLDLFIPKKNKTIIVANSDADKYESWKYICCSDDEDHIVETIAAVLKNIKQNDMVQSALSIREKEVLRLVVQGLTNKEIADNLNISINTVLSHRKNISTKLGIKSVSGLCVYAMMNGIDMK